MTQTIIESFRMLEYRPISSLSSEGPIEFLVLGNTVKYIHPAHIYLYVKGNVQREMNIIYM